MFSFILGKAKPSPKAKIDIARELTPNASAMFPIVVNSKNKPEIRGINCEVP